MSYSKCAMPSLSCLLSFYTIPMSLFFNSKNFFYFLVLKEIRQLRKDQEEGMQKILRELNELREELRSARDKSFCVRGSELQVYNHASCSSS